MVEMWKKSGPSEDSGQGLGAEEMKSKVIEKCSL